MLDVNGIAEEMRVEGFEITAEDVPEVHKRLKDGRTYTGTLDREAVRLLQRQLAKAMGGGEVENAGFSAVK